MPASNDDIDDLFRAAMKVLDDETPSGYFEGLPNRTLARLEGSMETTSGTDRTDAELPPTAAKERNEDSGLHDIRSLASSQRQRLSSRRLGTSPPPVDEDILASTSGSWKSIALPEPAKMVSLPEISELPSKADIKAQQKADKLAAKEAKKRASQESIETPASLPEPAAAPVVPIRAQVSEAPLHIDEEIPSITAKGVTTAAAATAKGVTPMIGSRIADQKKSKAPLFAALGLGLAAAAGAVIYVSTSNKGGGDTANQPAAALNAPAGDHKAAEPPKPTAAPIEEPKTVVKEEPKVDPVPVEPTTAKTVKKPTPTGKKPEKQVLEVTDPGNGVKAPVKKEEAKKEPAKEGDPDFEQLLKESGYQKKEADKPKLEKKSLSAGDFKTGMAAVTKAAQGCYKGTQGTATVKLTIAPSGQVSKVSVSGVGAAEASCVEQAVRSATFPPWDGGPQSFGYSYMLSD